MNFEAELKTERGEYFRSLENKRLNNDKWQWYISWEDKLFDFIFYHERFYITVGEKYYTVETDGFRDYYDAYRFPKIIESFRLLPNKSDS